MKNVPQSKVSLPLSKQKIRYRMKGSDVWHESQVLSRGGKASGKNWAYLNIQDVGEEQPKGVYFDRDVEEWESLEVVNSTSASD